MNLSDIPKLIYLESKIFPIEDLATENEYLEFFNSGLQSFILKNNDDDWLMNYQIIPISNLEIYLQSMSLFINLLNVDRCQYKNIKFAP